MVFPVSPLRVKPPEICQFPSSVRSQPGNLLPLGRTAGFTLLEVLMVTSIILILMALSANVVKTDSGRADVNAALDNFDGALRTARMEARSKATHVWVCLRAVTELGKEGVEVAVFASRDGSANSSPDNLVRIGGSLTLRRVSMLDTSFATPDRMIADYQASSVDPSTTERLAGSTLSIDTGSQTFADFIICFNPHGVASIPGKSEMGLIEVLFSPASGGSKREVKTSSVLLSRSTGISHLYR